MCFMLLSTNPLKMYFCAFVLKLWMHECVCKWVFYLKSATWSKGLSPSKPITKIFNNSNNNKIIKWKCFRNTHFIILVSFLKCVIVWLLCCLNFWSNTSLHSTRSLRGEKHTHNVQLYVNLVNHSCEFWPFRHCHSDEQAHSLSFTKGKKAQLTSGFYCSYCCHIFTDLNLCVEEAGGSLVFLWKLISQ